MNRSHVSLDEIKAHISPEQTEIFRKTFGRRMKVGLYNFSRADKAGFDIDALVQLLSKTDRVDFTRFVTLKRSIAMRLIQQTLSPTGGPTHATVRESNRLEKEFLRTTSKRLIDLLLRRPTP